MPEITMEQFAVQLREAGRKGRKMALDAIEATLLRFQAKATAMAMTRAFNTGEMARGYAVIRDMDAVRLLNEAAHAVYVERGRQPGRMPPPDAIALWAQRALGIPADDAKSAGWAIAVSIAREGVEARPVLTDPLYVERVADACADAVGSALLESIS